MALATALHSHYLPANYLSTQHFSSEHLPLLETMLPVPAAKAMPVQEETAAIEAMAQVAAGQAPADEQMESPGSIAASAFDASQECLVARALQGDQVAFAEIVDQYSTLMLRTAYMIVGDQDTAEDIVQDAFIQAWHHLPDLRRAGALRPWLMRIVVNQCISLKRRTARSNAFVRQALSEHETDMLAQVADDHKGKMERDWDLAQAITLLPLKQRVVIVLHYYYSMTLPEMASTLRTSENTLKKRIQAALINLRRLLHVANDEIIPATPSTFPAA